MSAVTRWIRTKVESVLARAFGAPFTETVAGDVTYHGFIWRGERYVTHVVVTTGVVR